MVGYRNFFFCFYNSAAPITCLSRRVFCFFFGGGGEWLVIEPFFLFL